MGIRRVLVAGRRGGRCARSGRDALALAPHALGQQAAGIIGQVTDESGAVLPGVTVTATSPALQVPSVVSVTDGRGDYRLTPLPIGTYTVEYTLAGFQTVRARRRAPHGRVHRRDRRAS